MDSELAKIYNDANDYIRSYINDIEPKRLQRIGKPFDGDYVLPVSQMFIDKSKLTQHLPDSGNKPMLGKLPWHISNGLWNQVGGNWQYAPIDDRLNNPAKASALVDYFQRNELGSNIYAPPFKASLTNW